LPQRAAENLGENAPLTLNPHNSRTPRANPKNKALYAKYSTDKVYISMVHMVHTLFYYKETQKLSIPWLVQSAMQKLLHCQFHENTETLSVEDLHMP